mmetsp:Transcript_17037/g.25740  ORF Transcript_17037/g.25740 Transcript_17037/m.25740 type:complete len:195 (-) Transcript_17037:186-770(-)|eukprot:CAMPEP_0206474346 /NCGR_PEP_ID=MMETSP0324_2-20121206/33431_1 /ASSEMBLY_ACC=CAM_ASM_000836 /TAXON_ID=2866 /ORGANISM="Crypthecodinium cohnii, Strain Seligo" /LENGTH=194 /DNA_ID=CAMNT_0053949499 /DNA_START=40 /DNA_END=624 /DNA_ORIENTATION=+
MPSASLGNLRTIFLATAFEEPLTEQEIENSNFTEVEGGLVKDIKDLNLGADADTLPLCEDLGRNSVGAGDSCWSTCQGQCINDVLKPGLQFDFDEIADGHAGCASHFECVGNEDRQLCHAVRSLDLYEMPMPVLAWACVEPPARRPSEAPSTTTTTRTTPSSHQGTGLVSSSTSPASAAPPCQRWGRGRSSDFL